MSGTFFVSWALWEQMSFVLGAAIVIVFCIALVKLWWTNRMIKKYEILDEEKRQRLQEMRRTGLNVKQANEIPFGIRAIQSGIEVDGIWISRPPSPVPESDRLHSTSTLVSLEPSSQGKGKDIALADDTRTASSSTINFERSTPKHDQSERSILQRLNDVDSFMNSSPTVVVAGPGSQPGSQVDVQYSRAPAALDGDQSRRPYDMYRPSAPQQRGAHWSSPRNSSSSSAGSTDSQAQPAASGPSNPSYTSGYNTRKLKRNTGQNAVYSAVPQDSISLENDSSEPYDTPLYAPSAMSTAAPYDAQASTTRLPELSLPDPTFGPGDLHANKYTRKVNPNFEVLPAGTFPPAQDRRKLSDATELVNLDKHAQASKAPQPAGRSRIKPMAHGQPEGRPF